MDVTNGQLVTTGSTSAVKILITDLTENPGDVEHMIQVVAGTIKFGRNAVGADQHGFTSADGSFIMTMPNGELFAQCAADTDTFRITV